MYRNLVKVSYKNMSHEEWLEHRKGSIGGSEAAAIVGLNPFETKFTVWADKLGKLPPKEETEAMRIGNDLEEYVAKRFCEETGKKVRRENSFLHNPDFPFAHATVDRLVIGEDAGLECKTTSVMNLKRFKNGEYPANYYVQCMHYMMVTGAKRWYLAVLILGKEFTWFTIERDEEEINALRVSEEEFWNLVETKQEPEVDGSDKTSDAITHIFAESEDDVEVSLMTFGSKLQAYQAVKSQIKEFEEMKTAIENEIKVFMENASSGYCGKYKVSWKNQDRNTFDSKRFMADHPEFDYSGYMKKTVTRPFKVTEIENNI